MKFKLENVSPGVVICHVQEPISKQDVAQVLQGITKLLSNGRGRILIHFLSKAVRGEATPDYLEKALRQQKELACRMGGDIRYVIEGPDYLKVPAAFPDLDSALKSFQPQPDTVIQVEAKLKEKEQQVRKLTEENRRLVEKLKELTEIIRKPSTDLELKAAVMHYRVLVAETEQAAIPLQSEAKK